MFYVVLWFHNFILYHIILILARAEFRLGIVQLLTFVHTIVVGIWSQTESFGETLFSFQQWNKESGAVRAVRFEKFTCF